MSDLRRTTSLMLLPRSDSSLGTLRRVRSVINVPSHSYGTYYRTPLYDDYWYDRYWPRTRYNYSPYMYPSSWWTYRTTPYYRSTLWYDSPYRYQRYTTDYDYYNWRNPYYTYPWERSSSYYSYPTYSSSYLSPWYYRPRSYLSSYYWSAF